MLVTLSLAVLGATVGHLARRTAPRLARVKDESGARWPWPEAIGATFFGFTAFEIGLGEGAAPVYPYLLACVGILVTDLRYKLIPDRITFPGTAAGLLASAVWPAFICTHFGHERWLGTLSLEAGPAGGLALALLGAAGGFGAFEALRRTLGHLFSMEVMGMGDSKLVMLIGALLGPMGTLLAFFVAMLCGVVIGVVYGRIFRTPHFPFGPALALGGYLTYVWPSIGQDILRAGLRLGTSIPRPALLVINLMLLAVAAWLVLRVRSRTREYSEVIREDYDRLEEE